MEVPAFPSPLNHASVRLYFRFYHTFLPAHRPSFLPNFLPFFLYYVHKFYTVLCISFLFQSFFSFCSILFPCYFRTAPAGTRIFCFPLFGL
jgi:hypothetical protein